MKQIRDFLATYSVVPVVVIDDASRAIPLGKVLMSAGLPIAEVTFRTEEAAETIKSLKQAYPSMLVGAGTISNIQDLMTAKEVGADFVVSPGINSLILEAAREISMPIIPGVSSASDIEMALNYNIDTVKFFPAEASGGVKMLKALLGPYPQLKVMPTGGINKINLKDYLEIPQVFAVGASWVSESALIKELEWDEIHDRVVQALSLSLAISEQRT